MKLTGKAKVDFDEWILEPDSYGFDIIHDSSGHLYLDFSNVFEKLPFSAQWGVYVDFFDSKGYLLYVEKFDDDNYDYTIVSKKLTEEVNYGDEFYDLHEVREAALKKVNEIYNTEI